LITGEVDRTTDFERGMPNQDAWRDGGNREFMWMSDMARALRERLGPAASKVSTRTLPDFVIRLAARFRDPSLQAITPALGRRARHSTAKALRVLGWEPRPAVDTVVDCATSLIERRVV
jgi:dihydroflavonol-4-reductase